jgi:2-polyprenyl-3-methyl-5-hydroxy-6-metoxy-1,4-benzoquinol methylase
MTSHSSTSQRLTTGEAGYLFDNARAEAQGRFAGLEASFDALTQRHLAARGLRSGWRCLEVGAGDGSIARWLARQAGPDGNVLATDIDTQWVETGGSPNLKIAEHDVATDPLPDAPFDLIHARAVLGHLPARDQVLARLTGALTPGGWLVVEDFDSCLPFSLDPVTDEEHAFVRVGQALIDALHRRGADTTYPRTLPRRLRAAGLAEVGASGHLVIYPGGSPEAGLLQANLDQVGSSMVDAGLATAADLQTAQRLLRDPAFIVGNHPLMITAWGRRPANATGK